MTLSIGESLRDLRKKAGLTQADMHTTLGFRRTTWASYESSKAEPRPSELLKISDFFGVPVDDILRGKLHDGSLIQKKTSENIVQKGNLNGNPVINPIPSKPAETSKTERIKQLQELADDVMEKFGRTGVYNVYDFDGHAAAGQAIALLERDKKRQAPNMYLPGLGSGLHIRVTATGESMFPSIKPGDKAVSTWVSDLRDVRSGEVYLVIDIDDGAVYKRLYRQSDTHIRFESDNEQFKPYTRHLEDIVAIFRVREVHSTDLRPYWVDIRRDVAQLKAEMEDIRSIRTEWSDFKALHSPEN